MTEKSVLVIEDDELNLKLVSKLLEIGNFRTLLAENAEAGIELARTHRPGVILMDVNLPGMDGFEATREIRKDPILRDTPVIALTAHAMEEDKEKAFKMGCNGYISKPIDIKNFNRIVNKVLKTGNKRKLQLLEDSYQHRILIVDDDPLNLKLLKAHLVAKGYRVITALHGEDALFKAEAEQPDLILLDIMMPGMDGYEVTKRLKVDAKLKDIPIMLVTALNGEDDKKKGLEAGADEFINKPINYLELEARVVSLLKLRKYQEQLSARGESENLMVSRAGSNFDREGMDCVPAILLVEDDAGSGKLITEYLSTVPCNIIRVQSGEEASAVVSKRCIDIMILDVLLPGMNGFEVCAEIKGKEESMPIQVVMVTSLSDTQSKLRGIEAGADEFLVKPVNKEELRVRIRALLKKKAYLDRLRSGMDTALHAAITDRLTGIYNHGYFKNFLELELNRAMVRNHSMALLMIDVDDFKRFNDEYGHPCGDKFLQIISKLIKENVREIDFVARYGGEEFAVALPYADVHAAGRIAKRLLDAIRDHDDIPFAPGARLSASIGISICPDHALTPEELLRTADCALYKAKRNGKNQYHLYTGSDHLSANATKPENNIYAEYH